ncbi:hypothetical protein PV327_001124 [Microctonus hyperodae]|uniref:Uncharacterized protein n=1 Tax=Microctonus hyperodae TaxID=165561 RepID=A0AA39G8R6_MICHY|nr:hypothetical protein PV327_001124 [Microctonus hyperodae]
MRRVVFKWSRKGKRSHQNVPPPPSPPPPPLSSALSLQSSSPSSSHWPFCDSGTCTASDYITIIKRNVYNSTASAIKIGESRKHISNHSSVIGAIARAWIEGASHAELRGHGHECHQRQ